MALLIATCSKSRPDGLYVGISTFVFLLGNAERSLFCVYRVSLGRGASEQGQLMASTAVFELVPSPRLRGLAASISPGGGSCAALRPLPL